MPLSILKFLHGSNLKIIAQYFILPDYSLQVFFAFVFPLIQITNECLKKKKKKKRIIIIMIINSFKNEPWNI